VDLDPVKGFVAEAKPAGGGANAVGADPSNSRLPSAAPPPSSSVSNLVAAMNTQSTPEASTKPVTMNGTFSGGGSAVNGGAFTAPVLPPPPGSPPPLPPKNTDPVSNQPISFNCATDNTCGGVAPSGPTSNSTGVTFHISVF
jgi:hypothetical protein